MPPTNFPIKSYPQVINLLTQFPLIITITFTKNPKNLRNIIKNKSITCGFVDNSVHNVSISLWIIHICE